MSRSNSEMAKSCLNVKTGRIYLETTSLPKAKSEGRGAGTVIAQVFMFSNAIIVALYSSLRMDRSASKRVSCVSD
jgi:hypothetical protein